MMLCHGEDPELWFSGVRNTRRAKEICNRCPAREACLAQALDEKIAYGIWGGLNERERHRILHPRKSVRRPSSTLPIPEPSAVRGVSWNAHKGRWGVSIRHGGREHWLGSFVEQAAAEAVAIAKCVEFGTTTVRGRSGKKKIA